MEFLVYMEVGPLGTPEEALSLIKQEAERSKQLAQAGIIRRLWRVPGRRANWGIWNAATATELHNAIASLPLYPYITATVHPLANHPNDPNLPLQKSDT